MDYAKESLRLHYEWKGKLEDVPKGADTLIGVSAPNAATADMVRSMARDPILFTMSNPTPEILPDIARKAGAAVVGTGRSDFPNQINNVLAFPGNFLGVLDVRTSGINDEMEPAAAHAIADLIPEAELSCENTIPPAFDERAVPAVTKAVAMRPADPAWCEYRKLR
jgi:malate dehydrogenase (oxaloacetate-decarboxylating)